MRGKVRNISALLFLLFTVITAHAGGLFVDDDLPEGMTDDRLHVNGNDELIEISTEKGWTGSGTIDDPVIVHERTFIPWEESGNNTMIGTSLHVNFSFCTFSVDWSGYLTSGIDLSYCSNITFYNCTFIDGNLGIGMDNCTDILFDRSAYQGNDLFIRIDSSSGITLRRGNISYRGYQSGIEILGGSRDIIVEDHHFSYRSDSITILDVHGITVYNCHFEEYSYISINGGKDIDIIDNVFDPRSGIHFHEGMDFELGNISGNTAGAGAYEVLHDLNMENATIGEGISVLDLLNVSHLGVSSMNSDGEGISIRMLGCDNISVEDCTFDMEPPEYMYSNGLRADDVENISVRSCSSVSTISFERFSDVIIEDVDILSSTDYSYCSFRSGFNLTFRENTATGVTFYGDFGGCFNSTIRDNTITCSSSYLFLYFSDGILVQGNHLTGFSRISLEICTNTTLYSNSIQDGYFDLGYTVDEWRSIDFASNNTIWGREPRIMDGKDLGSTPVEDYDGMSIILGCTDVLLQGLQVSDWNSSYMLIDCNGVEITECIISGDLVLDLIGCSNVTISKCSFIDTDDMMLLYIEDMVIEDNTVMTDRANWLDIENSVGITIKNNEMISNGTGSVYGEGAVKVYESDRIVISGNIINGTFTHGVKIRSSTNFSIDSNNLSGMEEGGISVSSSDNGTIGGNNVTFTRYDSIYVGYSEDIELFDNMIGYSLSNGITVSGSSRLRLYDNIVSECRRDGVEIERSRDCSVYWNDFLYNAGTSDEYNISCEQASAYGNENISWIGPDGMGNYWRDLQGPDDDGDGICDIPYVINYHGGEWDPAPEIRGGTEEEEEGSLEFIFWGALISVFILIMMVITYLMVTDIGKGEGTDGP